MSAWDEPRCIWCHKTDGKLKLLLVRVPNAFGLKEHDVSVSVHTEHEDETRRYYVLLCRYARTFLLSVLLGVVALVVFAVFDWEPGPSAVVIYYGVIFMALPFATPTTVEMVGIKNSVRLARVAGVVLIVGGALLHFMR